MLRRYLYKNMTYRDATRDGDSWRCCTGNISIAPQGCVGMFFFLYAFLPTRITGIGVKLLFLVGRRCRAKVLGISGSRERQISFTGWTKLTVKTLIILSKHPCAYLNPICYATNVITHFTNVNMWCDQAKWVWTRKKSNSVLMFIVCLNFRALLRWKPYQN